MIISYNTMLKLVEIKKVKFKLLNLFDLIDDNIEDDNELSDITDLDVEIIKEFKKKDKKWLHNTFKVIEDEFKKVCNRDYKIDNLKFRDLLLNEFGNRKNYNVIIDLLCGKIKLKSYDKLNIEDIKNLRQWQKDALNKIAETGFNHGIFNVIMGAGKSIFELLLIEYHFRNILTNIEQQNATYIIVSSRKSILNQIFNFNDINKQKEKFTKYKQLNQFTSDNFNIIDLVNNKNISKINIYDDKSNLVVINIQFLKSIMKDKNKDFYNKITKNLKLVLFDECHNISANSVYIFFELIKTNTKACIIGLSATPMRTQKQARNRTHIIFSTDNENINILYTYDLFEGIKSNTILPFKIRKFKFKGKIKLDNKTEDTDDDVDEFNDSDNIDKREKRDKKGFENIEYAEKETDDNRLLVRYILNNEINDLPYKKGIGFCKDINSANEWKKYLENNINNINIYITHSGNKDIPEEDEYEEFKNLIPENNSDINSFLIAVGRCSEGCDIDYLDFAICLDPVKNSDIVVMLQKFGRITRVDNENISLRKKIHALIFDTYVENKKKKLELTVNSVITYYNSFLQNTDNKSDEYTNKLLKLFNNTQINKIKNEDYEVRIKIDDDKKHDTIIIWNNLEDTSFESFKEEFNNKLKEKVRVNNIDNNDFYKKEYNLLRDRVKKIKFKSKDDYKEYAKLNNLELEPEKKYIDYGWKNYYKFLNIKTDTYSKDLNELKYKVRENKIRTEKDYINKCSKYNLPLMPKELYPELNKMEDLFE